MKDKRYYSKIVVIKERKDTTPAPAIVLTTLNIRAETEERESRSRQDKIRSALKIFEIID